MWKYCQYSPEQMFWILYSLINETHYAQHIEFHFILIFPMRILLWELFLLKMKLPQIFRSIEIKYIFFWIVKAPKGTFTKCRNEINLKRIKWTLRQQKCLSNRFKVLNVAFYFVNFWVRILKIYFFNLTFIFITLNRKVF